MHKIILFILLVLPITTQAQNMPGMTKKDIVALMKQKYPDFDLDEGAVNSTYKYLKYVDKYNEETWLLFLNDKEICTHTKLMSDFSNQKLRVKELNTKYKKKGNNNWEYTEKGVNYKVELITEDWYFTIVTKKK